jgi:hypothetical protein
VDHKGTAVKRMAFLGASVRRMKELTMNIETVTLIGAGT